MGFLTFAIALCIGFWLGRRSRRRDAYAGLPKNRLWPS